MVANSHVNKKALPDMKSSNARLNLKNGLLLFSVGRDIRQILGAAADGRIGCAAARNYNLPPAVHAASRQTFTVDGLDEYAGYFL